YGGYGRGTKIRRRPGRPAPDSQFLMRYERRTDLFALARSLAIRSAFFLLRAATSSKLSSFFSTGSAEACLACCSRRWKRETTFDDWVSWLCTFRSSRVSTQLQQSATRGGHPPDGL